jgi:hypothetical protein
MMNMGKRFFDNLLMYLRFSQLNLARVCCAFAPQMHEKWAAGRVHIEFHPYAFGRGDQPLSPSRRPNVKRNEEMHLAWGAATSNRVTSCQGSSTWLISADAEK